MLRTLNIIIALSLIIGINLLSYQFFTRFDFTEGKIYTLSDSSKNLTKNLPDKLKVKVFLRQYDDFRRKQLFSIGNNWILMKNPNFP